MHPRRQERGEAGSTRCSDRLGGQHAGKEEKSQARVLVCAQRTPEATGTPRGGELGTGCAHRLPAACYRCKYLSYSPRVTTHTMNYLMSYR